MCLGRGEDISAVEWGEGVRNRYNGTVVALMLLLNHAAFQYSRGPVGGVAAAHAHHQRLSGPINRVP